MTSGDFASLQISTEMLPVADRLPFWRETFGRQFCHLDIEPLSDDPLKAHVSLCAIPGMRTMDCVMSPARQQRTPAFVADGDDSIALPINIAGSVNFSQRGRDVSLGGGEAVVLLHAEPGVMTHSRVHAMGLVVPRAALAPFVKNIEDAAMRVIPHDNAALRLLTSYVKTILDGLSLATPEMRRLVAMHVHQLIAVAIGATQDGAAAAAEDGVKAARLSTIKAYVTANLERRDLSLVSVAARQRVTPRYVQMLFEQDGTTFSQFVLARRLARAHDLLTDPAHLTWNIGAIALAAGFGDLSHFNRSFRRHYGVTPSDVRFAHWR